MQTIFSLLARVQGKLVYGNYGRQEDLNTLEKKSIELRGCVMLLRAGRIGFPQQVCERANSSHFVQ